MVGLHLNVVHKNGNFEDDGTSDDEGERPVNFWNDWCGKTIGPEQRDSIGSEGWIWVSTAEIQNSNGRTSIDLLILCANRLAESFDLMSWLNPLTDDSD